MCVFCVLCVDMGSLYGCSVWVLGCACTVHCVVCGCVYCMCVYGCVWVCSLSECVGHATFPFLPHNCRSEHSHRHGIGNCASHCWADSWHRDNITLCLSQEEEEDHCPCGRDPGPR